MSPFLSGLLIGLGIGTVVGFILGWAAARRIEPGPDWDDHPRNWQ